MLAMVVFVIFISLAERRLPVQYAKRVVGRKMMGGNSTNIPMKLNMSGVLPIIFAQTIASIPATIAAFVPSWQDTAFMRLFDTTSVFYCIFYFLLIVGFSYFYATIQFNPVEVANNLKKQGGFIPGFRPGRPTVEFISKVLNKITMFGALYLSVVAILPHRHRRHHRRRLSGHRRHLGHDRGFRRAGDPEGPGGPDDDAPLQGLFGVRSVL